MKRALSCVVVINFCIMLTRFMTGPRAWGYGRYAWTAGAFGSLTNGQALPFTYFYLFSYLTYPPSYLLYFYLSSYLLTFLSIQLFNLSIFLPTDLFIFLPISYLFTFLPTLLTYFVIYVHLHTYFSIYLSIYSIYFFIFLYFYLSINIFTYLPIYLLVFYLPTYFST